MSNVNKLPSLSIFFPAFNEAGNIKLMIKSALQVAPHVARRFEIIIVDDGSHDQTYQIAKNLSKRNKNIKVVTQQNKGYGGAVKRGFKEARYEWVFFTDADRQFNLEDLKKFNFFTKDYDLVIGYRINRAEGLKRQLLADALKIWNKVFLGFPSEIKDIDCAFKLIHKSVLDQTLPLKSNGAMITTELLLKAFQNGFRCKQIGVKHYPRQSGISTGNNPQVILKAIHDTFMLQKQFKPLHLKPSFKKNLQPSWLISSDVVQ